MGKLTEVLSRRLLWFPRQRSYTAGCIAILICLMGAGCSENDDLVSPSPVTTVNNAVASNSACTAPVLRGHVVVPGYQNRVEWNNPPSGCSVKYYYIVAGNTEAEARAKGSYQLAARHRSFLDPGHVSGSSSFTDRYYRLELVFGSNRTRLSSEILHIAQSDVEGPAPPEADGPGIFRADVPWKEGSNIRYKLRTPEEVPFGSLYFEFSTPSGEVSDLVSVPPQSSIRGDTRAYAGHGRLKVGRNRAGTYDLSAHVIDDRLIEATRDTLILRFYNTSPIPDAATFSYTDTLVVHEGVCDRAYPVKQQVLFWNGFRDFAGGIAGFLRADMSKCHLPDDEMLASMTTLRLFGEASGSAADLAATPELTAIEDVDLSLMKASEGFEPPMLAADASGSSVSRSSLPKLNMTPEQFEGLTSVVDLWIHDFDLTGVDWSRNPFSSFSSVEQIWIANVKVDDLPNDVFEGVNSTRDHCPDRSLYSDLDGNPHCNLVSLRITHVAVADGGSLGADILEPLPELRALTMGWWDGISQLPDGFLDDVEELVNFRLGHMGLTSVDEDLLENQVDLYIFEFSANPGVTLPDGLLPDSLVYVTMIKNEWTTLNADLFQSSMPVLRRLNMSENQLTSFPAGLLARFPQLETLDLTDNDLEALPDGMFRGLQRPIRRLLLGKNPGPDGDVNTADFVFPLELQTVEVDDSTVKLILQARLGSPLELPFEANVFGGHFGDDVGSAKTRMVLRAGQILSDTVTLTKLDTVPYAWYPDPSEEENTVAELVVMPEALSLEFSGVFRVDGNSIDPVMLFDASLTSADVTMPVATRSLPKITLMRGGSYHSVSGYGGTGAAGYCDGGRPCNGPTPDGDIIIDLARYFKPRGEGRTITVDVDLEGEFLAGISQVPHDPEDPSKKWWPLADYLGVNPDGKRHPTMMRLSSGDVEGGFRDLNTVYRVPVQVYDDTTYVTITSELEVEVVAPDHSRFNIDWIDAEGSLSADVAAAIDSAADRWGDILADMPDVRITPGLAPRLGCFGAKPDRVIHGIDDLLILVVAVHDDGPGNTLAGAAPCFLRDASDAPTGNRERGYKIPLMGYFYLDLDDVPRMTERGTLVDVITHEIGHILGIGAGPPDRHGPGSWYRLGNCSNEPTKCFWFRHRDPYVSGWSSTSNALTAFKEANAESTEGDRLYRGRAVPIEPGARLGSSGGHWRESVFVNELMTPIIDQSVVPRANATELNPLSAITAGVLKDLGYGLNSDYLDALDSYCLPNIEIPSDDRVSGDLPCKTAAHTSADAADEGAVEYRSMTADQKAEAGIGFDLRGDLLNGPIFVLDEETGELRVINR